MCLGNYSLTYSASAAKRHQCFPGVPLKLLNGCIVRLLLSKHIKYFDIHHEMLCAPGHAPHFYVFPPHVFISIGLLASGSSFFRTLLIQGVCNRLLSTKKMCNFPFGTDQKHWLCTIRSFTWLLCWSWCSCCC